MQSVGELQLINEELGKSKQSHKSKLTESHFESVRVILNLMSATWSKMVGTGATKDWESWGMLKTTC